jgi:hypothetical protein
LPNEKVLAAVSIACAAALFCHPAHAAQASSDTAVEGEALEEITVTAEKQSENLQKTAADVTAISADALIESGVTDLR